MKYLKNKTYDIEVNGEMQKCKYLGSECGADVFEILNTTKLVFKAKLN